MTNPYTRELEDALKALGINPHDAPIAKARAWISGRDDDRRERDRATAAHGAALAQVQARDMRIAGLEAMIEATHKVFDRVNVTWSTGDDAGRLPLPRRAEFAVDPGFLAAKSESLKTANAALKRICEILAAPAPVCPEDAVTAVCSLISECEIANADAEKAEEALQEISRALDTAGAPSTYSGGGGEPKPIPAPERIRLLGATLQRVSGDLFYQERIASSQREDIRAAEIELNDAGAPAFASGDGQPMTVLDLAARVRALKV